MNKKSIILTIVILVIIVVGVFLLDRGERAQAEYGPFAQCIADSGTTFFGAFWCPHCIEQKRTFGKAHKLLPYVECSTPDKQGQTQVCLDEKIESYPTWEFADGERLTGAQSLETLSAKTGCELPDSENAEA